MISERASSDALFLFGDVEGLLYLCGMKNLYKYCAKFLIIFLFLLSGTSSSAQTKLRLLKISVKFPVVTRIHTHSSESNDIPDWSSSEVCELVFDSSNSNFITQTQQNDSIFYTFNSNTPSLPVTYNIHFLFDTVNHQIKDFFAHRSYTHSEDIVPNPYTGSKTTHIETTAFFKILEYITIGDTLLMVQTTGKACEQRMDSGSYLYTYINAVSGKYPKSSEKDEFSVRLSDDTSNYDCLIKLIIAKPLNYVPSSKLRQSNVLNAVTSLPTQKVIFSFPDLATSENFVVTDILGRVIMQKVLPSGISDYSIPQGELKQGYYFARLGSLTTHFIVN